MKKYLLLLPLLCFPLHGYAQDVDFGDIDIGDDDDAPAAAPTKTLSPEAAEQKARFVRLLADNNERLRQIEFVLDMPSDRFVKRGNEAKEVYIAKDNNQRLKDIQKVLAEPGTQLIRHNSVEESTRDVEDAAKRDGVMDVNSRPIYTN